jgi:two-component system, LuxR family, sensor histidine kinase TtrS
MTLRLLFILLALWLPVGAHGDLLDPPVYRVGVLAVLSKEATHAQWQPLVSQIQARLPDARIELATHDPAHMEMALHGRELAFVVTNPGHYVQLESRHGATRIATQTAAEGGDPAHAVGSAVLVRAARAELQQLDDLKNRTVAMVSDQAFGGYQLVAALLRQAGLDADKGHYQKVITGYPMTHVIEAVASGQADAGIVRTCLLEQMAREHTIAQDAFRVLPAGLHQPAAHPELPCQTTTPLYPGWAFAVLPHVPPEIAHQVALALLTLPREVGETRWSAPADYQRVHEVLRTLEVEPYEFLRLARIEALLQRHWPWVAGGLMALMLWLLYTLRVEWLVKKRTEALTRTLDERDRLAIEVEKDRDALHHLSRLSILGELSATLGHELNQPLATISNYACGLQRRMQAHSLTPEALDRALRDIGSEAERAAGVLEGIRNMARKRKVQRQTLNAEAMVASALRLFKGLQVHAPPLALRCASGAEHSQIAVDPQPFQQVLLNLLKNALDVHQQAALDHAAIQVTLDRSGGQLSISIQDQGPALSNEQRSHLFEPFFTTKPDGLGLGLPICRTIVEAHGGSLQAYPVDPTGQRGGMVFDIRVPEVAHHPTGLPLCPAS